MKLYQDRERKEIENLYRNFPLSLSLSWDCFFFFIFVEDITDYPLNKLSDYFDHSLEEILARAQKEKKTVPLCSNGK